MCFCSERKLLGTLVFTALAVRAISGTALDIVGTFVTSGSGDHLLRPNGCHNLSIVLTNTSGAPVTGISTVLSFYTVLGVEITQPYSSYMDISVNGQSTNLAPFQVSTLPTFFCDDPIFLRLSVFTTSHGTFILPLVLNPVGPPTAPDYFDVTTPTNLSGAQLIESTNVVSGVVVQMTNIAVSVWLSAPIDSNVTMSLVAPNGAEVVLTSGNGGTGSNYGIACSPDSNRTTFDDSAAASITSGNASFVGTFRPQVALSNLLTSPLNGNWRLRVVDNGSFGNSDTLQCWSLLLYPLTCSHGSGNCGFCLPPIVVSITTNDPVVPARVSRNLVISRCAGPKTFPGTVSGSVHYHSYTFTNTSPSDACVTIDLRTTCDIQASAYLYNFDPLNIASNYLGDAGWSANDLGIYYPFSCTVPAGATFVVVVNEIDENVGCTDYTLALSGLPCPSPALAIATITNSQTKLSWPDSAGGYVLETSPSIKNATWSVVTNEPLIENGSYRVTNDTAAPSKFYRLHKP